MATVDQNKFSVNNEITNASKGDKNSHAVNNNSACTQTTIEK